MNVESGRCLNCNQRCSPEGHPDAVECRDALLETQSELVRVLLSVGWIEWTHCSTCPSCGKPAELVGHADDCALVAVLRKAGVR